MAEGPAAFDANQQMFMMQSLSRNSGGGEGYKILGIPLFGDVQTSLISMEACAPGSFFHKNLTAINMNPSNPNGLIARIFRALGFDKFLQNINLAGAQKEQHHYTDTPFKPGATPDMSHASSGHEIG